MLFYNQNLLEIIFTNYYIEESFESELKSAAIVPLSFGILKNCLKKQTSINKPINCCSLQLHNKDKNHNPINIILKIFTIQSLEFWKLKTAQRKRCIVHSVQLLYNLWDKRRKNGWQARGGRKQGAAGKDSNRWYDEHKWVRSLLIPNDGGIVPDTSALLR